ncbi:MAG TPA: 16S rRNA (guanine(966)-N(2))-methyltransferase RsmD [Candidatus Aminicenantes bacterium]|nr:16S rRNA (guanine(966)-N(2))-methyltransferase RsmD [Candidatus Aminicenantes bacterium]
MRITGGRYRGHSLLTPRSDAIRPAMDRVRVFLFEVISARLPDARVLDLFAGTGSLGIEALSRGAARADFVDTRGEALALIRQNLERLQIPPAIAATHRRDAIAFCATAAADAYDLVFCDPPYAYPHTQRAVEAIAAAGLLTPEGLLVVEHDLPRAPLPARFVLVREKEFGRTTLSLMARDVS